MPSDATDILDAVKAALEAAYPDIPVRVSKRAAAGEENAKGGWQVGFPSTCFVLSCNGPEEIDGVPSFTHLTVGYPVVIEYVKPAQAAISGAANTGSPVAVEDPDVREKRAALRAALYKPRLTGAPAVFDVRHTTRPAYEHPADGKAVLLVSGEGFTYVTSEPRPR